MKSKTNALISTLILSASLLLNSAYCQEEPQEKTIIVKDLKFDKEKDIISYELTIPAWVRIRLGLKEGPMSKTLVDWEKRSVGIHEEKCGKEAEDIVFTFNYFTSGDEYIDAAGIDDMMPPEEATIGRSLPTLKINQIHKGHPRQYCHDPKVIFKLPKKILKTSKGAYIIKGNSSITIDLSGADKDWFRRERFSIHVFVDGIFAGGELEGYTPYTWILDPKNLNEGEHTVMFNLSGFNDHIGIAAVPIYVRKDEKQ